MNFLQLVQRAIRESGSIKEVPDSLSDLEGLSALFKNWVAESWREIQNERSDWFFRTKESVPLTIDPVVIPKGHEIANTDIDSDLTQVWKDIQLRDVFLQAAEKYPVGAPTKFRASNLLEASEMPDLIVGNTYYLYERLADESLIEISNFTITDFGADPEGTAGRIFIEGDVIAYDGTILSDGEDDLDQIYIPDGNFFFVWDQSISNISEVGGTPTATNELKLSVTEREDFSTRPVNTDRPTKIYYVSWTSWPMFFGRSSSMLEHNVDAQKPSRPRFFTINPEGNVWLNCKPDSFYVATFFGPKKVQNLEENTDEPIMPEDLHMGIVWRALMEYGLYHDDRSVFERARSKWRTYKKLMERRLAPDVTLITHKLYG